MSGDAYGGKRRTYRAHHVLIVETGGIVTPWRTWAECQFCDWKGPKRATAKTAEKDAIGHRNATV